MHCAGLSEVARQEREREKLQLLCSSLNAPPLKQIEGETLLEVGQVGLKQRHIEAGQVERLKDKAQDKRYANCSSLTSCDLLSL